MGLASYQEVFDILTYGCYKFNRNHAPHITPEQWAESGIFPKALEMEKQLKEE
jgi:hypothetical protein